VKDNFKFSIQEWTGKITVIPTLNNPLQNHCILQS